MRTTSDTYTKEYSSQKFISKNGIDFTRSTITELEKGSSGEWDSEMACYPARLDMPSGKTYLFYNI